MAKLRIVQLESFYGNFLKTYYDSSSGLENLAFRDQINRLLDSGYSGGHNVVPYLNPSRWQAHYIVPNSPWAQVQWARENGFGPGALSLGEILALQLERIEPDILYLSDIPGFDFSLLTRLKRRPLVVGWHATIVDPRIPWKEFDLVLSGIAAIRERALALGAKAAACYMPSAPAFRETSRLSGQRSGNVVFSGSFAGGIHNARAQQYRALASALQSGTVDIFTATPFAVENGERIEFHPPVYGSDVLSLYSRYRMVLDSRGDFSLGDSGRGRETSNMRLFEATRAGSLLVTEQSHNLGEYFVPGREIEIYESSDELIDKVQYYSRPENEARRQAIATAGFRRVMTEHLIEHRAGWFERILDGQFDLQARALQKPGQAEKQGLFDQLHCCQLDSGSLIFGFAGAVSLRRSFPASRVYVLCRDEQSLVFLERVGEGLEVLSSQQVSDWETRMGLTLELAPEELWPARMLRYLAYRHPQVKRFTYVDSSVEILDPKLLSFTPEDAGIYLLAYGFGDSYRHAEAALGPAGPEILSLGNGPEGMAFLDLLVRAGQGGSLPMREVLAAADDRELPIRSLPGTGPWNYGEKQNRPGDIGLFYFFLLRRRNGGTWEYLAFNEEPSWPDCYQKVYVPYLRRVEETMARHGSGLGEVDQESMRGRSAFSNYMLRRAYLAQYGYRLLTGKEFGQFRNAVMGWDSPSVALTQHQAFKALMGRYEAGERRADLRAMVEIFSRILRPRMSVLEEGCGSGYNFDFIRRTVQGSLHYVGIDLAPAMISLAKEVYPEAEFAVMGSENLQLADGSFDVVLNGASLMHTVDYDQAVREAHRVARRFVVLHTVTVCDAAENIYFEKNAYGSKVVEVCFSAAALNALLERNRLLPVLMEESIDYNLQEIVGVPTRSISLACYCLEDPPAEKTSYYCTYFDSNYLPRGIAMMRSLTRHDPRSHFFVLCLDEVAESCVRSLGSNMVAIGIKELMAADPEFAACRNNRSQIEWYFTATSAFVNYLLNQYPDVERLTYLDADLYFYAPPVMLHYEAEGASAQVIEHRFSPHLAELEVYGRFNVGWIGFFNTPEGRQVVADYRADCIEWCYDRLEGDRFGDQKYLERWPQRYRNCCVSQVSGANVGPWNLARWKIRKFADTIFVDSDRLVFFHFQGIKRVAPGEYKTGSDPVSFGFYYDLLYAPYIKELGEVDNELAMYLVQASMQEIRYPKR